MKRDHMTFKQKIAMHEMMSAHIGPDDLVPGNVKYAPGWNDERIAAECDAGIATVRRHRQANFGHLNRGIVSTDIASRLQDRISDLEDRVSEIERTSLGSPRVSVLSR